MLGNLGFRRFFGVRCCSDVKFVKKIYKKYSVKSFKKIPVHILTVVAFSDKCHHSFKLGEAIVTGAGDETLRFWNVFSKARSQKVP